MNGAILEAALALVARTGWPVFPTAGKMPAIEGGNGLYDATADPDALRALFARAPRADGFGVNGGAAGITVLDPDVKNGIDGRETLREAGLPYLEDTTPRALTPGGGSHVFYAGTVPSRSGVLPNVDIKSVGGYVILPPAPGRLWEADASPWDVPLAPVPDWLRKLAERKESDRKNDDHPADELHADDAAGLAMRLVSRATAAIAGGAKRHDTIRGAVLQARHNRVPYGMAGKMLPSLLDAANAIPGKEPYPLAQLQRLLRWTWEHVTPGEPWEETKRKLESYREEDEQPDAAALPVLIGEALEEPAPDIAFLVEGFLPTGALALVAAYGGVGKTTLLVQMAASLAAGRDFLGFRVPQAVPCLYLIAEGARHVFLARVKVALARLGLDPSALPFWITPREFTAEIGQKLAEYIERTGARFVVLDTFGLFHDGDENSASDFKAKVVKPLRAIMARHDVSFVLVTHEVKPNAERKGRHRVRGTSALVDDSDVAIRLEAPDGDRATARLLIFEKLRTGAAIDPIPLEFVPSAAIFERVGEEVMRERQAERSAEADARRLKDLEVQVIRYLKRDPDGLTKAELTAEVHPRRADLVRVLDKLRDESRAFPERDPRGRAMRWKLAAAPRLEMAG